MSSENLEVPEGGGNQGDESPESATDIPKRPISTEDLNLESGTGRFNDEDDVQIKIVGPNNEEILPEDIVVAPDGGWGWVVVFASFMSNLIVDGTLFSFGVLMDPIATSIKKNGTELLEAKTQVALVGSLLAGLELSAGPFVSSLSNIFGFRITAIAGSITAFFGFVMGWALNQEGDTKGPHFNTLLGFVGVIGGIGFSLIYLPTIITVGYYFEKKRALATGIALCGSGIGTFVYSPLVNFLLENLKWPKTLLVEACLLLCCGFLATLYRPLKPGSQALPVSISIRETSIPEDTAEIAEIEKGRSGIIWESGQAMSETDVPNEGAGAEDITGDDQPDSDMDVRVERLRVNSAISSGGSEFSESNLGATSNMRMSRRSIFSTTGGNVTLLVNPSMPNIAQSRIFRVASLDTLNNPLHRPDIFYIGSTREDTSVERMPSLEWEAVPVSVAESGALVSPPPKKSWCKCCTFTFPILRKMLDFSLLKSVTFVLLSCSGFISFLGFFVPYAFVGAIMREKVNRTTSSDATILIAVIGISNTIGRVICGLIADKVSSHILLINNLAVSVAGISSIIVPFLDSYPIFIIYACVYGLSIAFFISLRSILVVQLMGVKKLTNAFGLLCLFQGAAAIMGSPLAGYLKQITKEYDASFFAAGSFMLVSGVICYPLNHINRWEKNRRREKELVKVQV